jgi:hypothetical protein
MLNLHIDFKRPNRRFIKLCLLGILFQFVLVGTNGKWLDFLIGSLILFLMILPIWGLARLVRRLDAHRGPSFGENLQKREEYAQKRWLRIRKDKLSSLAVTKRPEQSKIRYVFTLVHGTWSTQASWTKEDSPLCLGIKKIFGDRCVFHSFSWRGHNTAFARMQAASDLSEELMVLHSKFKGAKHFIISHSHGGNIVHYGLRDRPVQKHISGVVCLSTPFLYGKLRDLYPLTWGGLTLVFWVTSATTVIDCLVRGANGIHGFILYFEMLLALGLSLVLANQGLSIRLSDKLRLVQLNCPVFVIRAERDEALIALVGSRMLHAVTTAFWAFVMKPIVWAQYVLKTIVTRVLAKRKSTLATIGICMLVFVLFFLLSPTILVYICDDTLGFWVGFTFEMSCPSGHSLYIYSTIGGALPGIVALGYFFGITLLIPVLIVAGTLSFIPLGFTLTLSHLLLDVTAKASIPWVAKEYVIPGSQRWALLKHSEAYQHPESIKQICDWLSTADRLKSGRLSVQTDVV